MLERWLSGDEIAAHLGVNPDTIYKWITHHLAPQGKAGFVLANGSMSSNQSGEGDIRRFMTSRKPLSFCGRNQTTHLEVPA